MTDSVAKKRLGWRITTPALLIFAIAISVIWAANLTWGDARVLGRQMNGITRLLEERSPGERGSAALTKLRKEAAKKEFEESHQRVLGKVFPPVPSSLVPAQELLMFPPLTWPSELEFPPIALSETVQMISMPNGGAPIYGAIIGGTGSSGSDNGGGAGGGGGGIGGGTGGGPVVGGLPPLVPELPSAVPEPGTWALLLLGAAFTAAALRRDRSRQRRPAVIDALA